MKNQIEDLSDSEILSLAAQKKEMFCPVCNSQLVTIPESFAEGQRPLGLSCPKNKNHFLIYGEDASRVQTMRDEMRAFREQQKNK